MNFILSYIGPGLGVGTLILIFLILIIIGVSFFLILWIPIKRFFKKHFGKGE